MESLPTRIGQLTYAETGDSCTLLSLEHVWLVDKAVPHAHLSPHSLTLQSPAGGSTVAKNYPDPAQFCGSGDFVDTLINNAVLLGRGGRLFWDLTPSGHRPAMTLSLVFVL